MLAAPIAALALGTTLVSGAVTSVGAHRSDDGAKKINECKGKQLKVRLGKSGVAAGSRYQDSMPTGPRTQARRVRARLSVPEHEERQKDQGRQGVHDPAWTPCVVLPSSGLTH